MITDWDIDCNTKADTEFMKEYLDKQDNNACNIKEDENNKCEENINIKVVDGAYYSEEIKKLGEEKGIDVHPTELVGKKVDNKNLLEFNIDNKNYQVFECPNKIAPISSTYNEENHTICAKFDKELCSKCPFRDKCVVDTSSKKANTLRITTEKLNKAVQKSKMNDTEYQKISNTRAAIEGIPSLIRRRYHIDTRANKGKVYLKMEFSAAILSINIKRASKMASLELNNGIFTNINKIKNSILSLNKRNVRKDKINIENNFNIKNELISKEEGKIECEICNELFVPNDKNTVKNCGHSFCSSCWYDSLSVKIKENKLPSIKCLDYNCKEKLSDEFIINILNTDIDLVKRYKRYKLELEIINDPNKKLCPYPNCDSYLELKDIKIKDVTCKNNHSYCFECLKKPHGNLPCNSNLYKSITEFAKNHFIKKCPKCGIIIEKNKGCNHITCIQCGYQWCWLCNQEYKSDHFSSGKCRGFQFYQPKNEYEIKLLMEGKINYNELSSSQRQLIELDNDANNNHPRHRPNHNNRAQRERNNRSIGDKIGEGIIAFFLILIYSPFLFFQPLFEWWIEIINSMHISYKGCMKFFIAFPCFCMTVIIFFPLRYFISFIILFCTMIICN